MQQKILEPLNPMTQSSLLSFAELFSFMLGEAGRPVTRGRVVPPIETNDMLLVFNRAVREVELGQQMLNDPAFIHDKDVSNLNRALVIALHLACLLSRLIFEEDCAKSVKKEILKSLYDLVKLNVSVDLICGHNKVHLINGNFHL
jgi:hypothetical protein